MNTKNSRSSVVVKEKKTVFFVFCFWNFILLCRQQDYLTLLAAFRPGLIATALMLAVVVFCSKEIQAPPFFEEKQVRYYSALCLTMVVGITTSLHVRVSFNTVFTEYIIVILYFCFFYKVVDTVSKLSVTLLLGCLGSGGYFVSSLLSGSLESGRLSYCAMFDPNDLVFFALSFMPLNLLFIRRNNALWIRLACLGVFASGTFLILLSGSRGGMLGYIMFLLVLLFKTNAIKVSMKTYTIISTHQSGERKLLLESSEKQGLGLAVAYPDIISNIEQLSGEFEGQSFPVAKKIVQRLLTLYTDQQSKQSVAALLTTNKAI